MSELKYEKHYSYLIITPKDLINLVNLCYEPLKHKLSQVERKWIQEELPKLEKKIDEHNKDVLDKKSVFSFNTYLPIDEEGKKVIIEKQKKYFKEYSEKIYSFDNEFKVSLSNGRSMTYSSPSILEDITWEQVKEIKLNIKARYTTKTKSVTFQLSHGYNSGISYTIESEDTKWVKSQFVEIEDFINKIQKPHKITFHKGKIQFFTSFIITYLIVSLLNRLNLINIISNLLILNRNILYWLISIVIFIFFNIKIINILNKSFPDFAIKKRYEPFNNIYIKGLFAVTGGSIINLIYDILKGLGVFRFFLDK